MKSKLFCKEKKIVEKVPLRFKKGKALLIGINYKDTDSELGGCINDVRNVYQYLTQTCKFDPALITILTDDDHTPDDTLPTKANILNGMKWLINNEGLGKDDEPISLFCHYSSFDIHYFECLVLI